MGDALKDGWRSYAPRLPLVNGAARVRKLGEDDANISGAWVLGNGNLLGNAGAIQCGAPDLADIHSG